MKKPTMMKEDMKDGGMDDAQENSKGKVIAKKPMMSPHTHPFAGFAKVPKK